MRWFKVIWHKLLIALRIREKAHYLSKKELIETIQAYQRSELAFLKNIFDHHAIAKRFKVADNLEADFSKGIVTFKAKD